MEGDQIIIHLDAGDSLERVMASKGFTPFIARFDEHKLYQPIEGTKWYYRMDKANNAPGQLRHIHVYRDDKGQCQLFAMNVDGTAHDGSKYQLPKKMFTPLQKLGCVIPPDGLIECRNMSGGADGRILLCD